MQEEIIEAFKELKSQLSVRDYDDERFIKDLPDNEPISLVIPFERTGKGYIDIFRSYIGGDKHPELSDEELLKKYLQTPQGQEDKIWGDAFFYKNPNYFRGYIEEHESGAHTNDKTGLQKNRFSQEEVNTLITALRDQGINAVTKQDEKSQDPSTVVVMDNGIITPFMDKETIPSLISKIKTTMSKCDFAVGGHISPISFEQLRSPLETEQRKEKTDFMKHFLSVFTKQPSIEMAEIKNLDQLNSSFEKIKINSEDEVRFIDQENGKNGIKCLWRGGILGDKAFIANIDTELWEAHALRKSYGMATPSMRYALNYAFRGGISDSYKIGFIYQYSTSGTEEYFPDRGIERQPTTYVLPGRKETPLFPHKHSLTNIYLVCKHEGDYLMRLDKDNPLHQELLKLYEPKDTRISGNLKQRRINQFNEAAKNDGHPCSYKATFPTGFKSRLSKCSETTEKMVQTNTLKKKSSLQQAAVAKLMQDQH